MEYVPIHPALCSANDPRWIWDCESDTYGSDAYCSGVPDVACSGVPDVACSGVPDVACSGVPDVACSGVPDVACSGVPDVACSGVPDVALSVLQLIIYKSVEHRSTKPSCVPR